MADAKTIIAVSAETHQLMKRLALDSGTSIYALTEKFLQAGLGKTRAKNFEEPQSYGHSGNAFTGIDVDPAQFECQHEHLDEDGICRACGKDCRGAA